MGNDWATDKNLKSRSNFQWEEDKFPLRHFQFEAIAIEGAKWKYSVFSGSDSPEDMRGRDVDLRSIGTENIV